MGNNGLKQILQKLRRKKRYTATCLKEPSDTGPTRDWSGPEIALDRKNQPVIMSGLICDFLSHAEESHADSIEFHLLEGKGDVSVKYGSPDGQEQEPNLPGYLWSCLVTAFPKFMSIESCQGVLTDPATKEKWRFIFRKETNEMSLKKVDSRENAF